MTALGDVTSGGRLLAGSAGLRRLQSAMTAAGLATFALLYSTQALLPSIGSAFSVNATTASLTISVTTGLVGLTVLPMSALAERLGRVRTMTAGLIVACIAVTVGAACTDFAELVVSRAVVGLALAAVVAVAMGHIGDEVDPAASGAAIGVYVSGTTLGGLVGRLVPAAVEDSGGWRWSLVALGVVGALATVAFVRLIPPSRQRDNPLPRGAGLGAAVDHLRDPGIIALCAAAMLLMGGFVATYNFLTFRLTAQPFDLAKPVVGLLFLAYLAGTVSSTVAGRLGRRIGRVPTLYLSLVVALAGLAVTLADDLVAIVVGLVVFTAGFFGCHATASAWVTVRAVRNKSHASALYLMAYYLGSSIGGTAIGLAWTSGGWSATVVTVGCCYLLAGACVTAVSLHDRRSPSR